MTVNILHTVSMTLLLSFIIENVYILYVHLYIILFFMSLWRSIISRKLINLIFRKCICIKTKCMVINDLGLWRSIMSRKPLIKIYISNVSTHVYRTTILWKCSFEQKHTPVFKRIDTVYGIYTAMYYWYFRIINFLIYNFNFIRL